MRAKRYSVGEIVHPHQEEEETVLRLYGERAMSIMEVVNRKEPGIAWSDLRIGGEKGLPAASLSAILGKFACNLAFLWRSQEIMGSLKHEAPPDTASDLSPHCG